MQRLCKCRHLRPKQASAQRGPQLSEEKGPSGTALAPAHTRNEVRDRQQSEAVVRHGVQDRKGSATRWQEGGTPQIGLSPPGPPCPIWGAWPHT